MPTTTGLHMCLVALVIALTTAAPVANEENLIDVPQSTNDVDRAKRADEMVYYGNQQNKAQLMAKKSDPDLSRLVFDVPAQGEKDEGGAVVAHEATPVEADLNSRAESALGDQADDRATAQAIMESAMHSSFGSANPIENKNVNNENEDEDNEEEEGAGDVNEETASSDNGGEDESADVTEEDDLKQAEALGDESDELDASNVIESDSEPTENTSVDDTSDDDDDDESKDSDTNSDVSNDSNDSNTIINSLIGSSDDAGSDKDDSTNADDTDDEVEQFLHSLGTQSQDKIGNSNSNIPATNRLELQLLKHYYNYVAPTENMFQFPGHFRQRRSSKRRRSGAPSIVSRRARRIKRDLYDGNDDDEVNYYGPLPWYGPSSEEAKENLLAGPDDYQPIADDPSRYFYTRLYNYLSDPYINNEKYYVDDEDLTDSDQIPEDWLSEQEYLQRERPYYLPYDPEDEESYIEVPLAEEKRGRIPDYSQRDRRKRYFFPFDDEPETHWGAFVPAKRSYADALERLQRLALALSDNQRPYQQDDLEEYRKK